jgi:uncharacterized membrane protein YjjP (DUF1212 family)
MAAGLFAAFLFLVWLAGITLQIYGIYVCFLKKWYFGAVALFVPGFALIVGAAKLFFKKDLLA